MSRGLFITATGTDVGKTYVTALILKKLREAGLPRVTTRLRSAEPKDCGRLPNRRREHVAMWQASPG